MPLQMPRKAQGKMRRISYGLPFEIDVSSRIDGDSEKYPGGQQFSQFGMRNEKVGPEIKNLNRF